MIQLFGNGILFLLCDYIHNKDRFGQVRTL
jgi:hypothetical protein